MSDAKLETMIRGWFVGNFEPTAFKTDACEVGCKTYLAGEKEERHFHRIATEVTLILNGRVRMNGVEKSTGDIVIIEPLVSTDFEVIEDTTTVVVKIPGAINDKYLGKSETE